MTFDDSPFTHEALLRLDNEPARERIPEAMSSYAAINGLMFEDASGSIRPKVGFKRLRPEESAVWTISASHAFRWGLPVRSRTRRRPGTSEPLHLIQEALQHNWNAKVYHPAAAPRIEQSVKRADGSRVIPTDSIDALIFNSDDRRIYYPKGYPWHCIGKLEISGGGTGSGALVGRDLVLTARHVVPWSSPNASIKFTPAFYESGSLLGGSFYSWVESATAYEGSDFGAWDFALLRLYQPLGDHLGFFGVRTYHDSWDDKPFWTACGYPAMSPFESRYPSYLQGIEVDDADEDGDATELESENQDNSKGGSGGPLFAWWTNGPYIIGVVSANQKNDYGLWTDYQVLNASGKAMVDMVGLARLEINTDIHINPPHLDLVGF